MTKNTSRGSKPGGTVSASGPKKSNGEWAARAVIDNPLEAVPAKPELTEQEQADLMRLETVIRGGWKTFIEVGTALLEVRDRKLYRNKYDSFEIYCREELGFSRPYAYNLIGSAEVEKQLSSIEDIEVKPANEAQCRELISVPKERREEVWKKALELAGEEVVTAKIVHQAAAKFKPKSKKTKRQTTLKTTAPDIKSALKLVDDIDGLAGDEDVKKLKATLAKLRELLEKISKAPAR